MCKRLLINSCTYLVIRILSLIFLYYVLNILHIFVYKTYTLIFQYDEFKFHWVFKEFRMPLIIYLPINVFSINHYQYLFTL